MPNHRKPTDLHLIQGTTNVTRHADRADEIVVEGAIAMPKFVKGRAAKIWEEYAAIGHWLTPADAYAFGMWCRLGALYEKLGDDRMLSSKFAQWRALAGELGFMCASRSRINTGKNEKAKDKTSRFFKRSS